ncbi:MULTISPECIES: hypothetical protein [unclassified Streptomyces]|uniref:hypothetical protein n=1 Tax=unclassified Streptomyces TaxID=2593676 RepID=UPI002E29678A|nr:hypothetical protein [Streptomyces sp. NBC_01439]
MAGRACEPGVERPSWWASAPGAEAVFAVEMIVGLTVWVAVPDSGDTYGQTVWALAVVFLFLVLSVLAPVVFLGLGLLHALVFTRPALALARRTGRAAAAVAWLCSVSAVSALLARFAGAPYLEALAWIAGIGVPPLLVAHLAHRSGTRPGTLVARAGIATPVLVLVAAAVVAAMSDAGAFKTYEPPTLVRAQYVGEWRGDDGDGAVRLYEGGDAAVERVAVHHFDGSVTYCTATGTWTERADDPRTGTRAGVEIDVSHCSGWEKTWQVTGTAARPALFHLVGDPDAGDVRILRRTGTVVTPPHG